MEKLPKKWCKSGEYGGENMANDDVHGPDDTQQVMPCEPAADKENKFNTRNRFFGSFIHGIDAKGRLIIPNSFREKLGNNFTIGPTADFSAIALYPEKTWMNLVDQLERKAIKNIRLQTYVDRFSRLCFDGCDTDGQGRLLLPQRLRSFCLKDAREVEVSGALGYIKIIDSALIEKEDELTVSEAPAMLNMLSETSLD